MSNRLCGYVSVAWIRSRLVTSESRVGLLLGDRKMLSPLSGQKALPAFF